MRRFSGRPQQRLNVHPIVHRRYRVRRGKGFSREELKALNLSLKMALRLGIPVDPRRRSRHDENVEALKRLLETELKSVAPTERREAEEAKSAG